MRTISARKRFCLWLLLAWISLGLVSLVADAKNYVPGELLVLPRAGKEKDLAEFQKRKGHKVKKTHKEAGELQVVEVASEPESIAQEYVASGAVVHAEPNYIWRASAIPNDPAFGLLWGLNNHGVRNGVENADIDAPQAWQSGVSASNIVVAVIDSGVRYTHEDLAGNMWRNPREIADGLDNDGNRVIDDIHGYNAADGSGNPWDANGHGTHVAGTVGAVGNNGKGVTGVAWNVQIMALRFMDAEGNGSTAAAINCIDYAISKGAKVINASWAAPTYSYFLEQAIVRARARGIIFVAAAGNELANNDLLPSYPANYSQDNIVSVAATTPADLLDPNYSNYGVKNVDIAAPGTAIYSTWHTADDSYAYLSGTSMATPHVAGAFALLKARFPTESHTALINRLYRAADKLPSLSGKTVTGARLNIGGLFTPRWNLSVSSIGEGTVQSSPPQPWYYDQSSVMLVATPAAGYQFLGWTGGSSNKLNPLKVTLTDSLAVQAIFAPLYQLSIVSAQGGSVEVQGGLQAGYEAGTSVTLTAVPAGGFVFAGWKNGGSAPTATLVMDGDHNVEPIFAPAYRLSVEPHMHGKVQIEPAKEFYSAGEVVTVRAVAASGFLFSGWRGSATGSTPELQVSMTADQLLGAEFVKEAQLSVSAGEGGKVLQSDGPYREGEKLEFRAVADEGYEFVSWTGALNGDNPESTLVLSGENAVGAHFTPVYSLQVAVEGEGNVANESPKNRYRKGAIVKLIANPAEGHRFVGWTGSTVSTNTEVALEMSASQELVARFEKVPEPEQLFTVTIEVVGPGQTALEPRKAEYKAGEQVNLTGVAEPGGRFVGWAGAVESTNAHLIIAAQSNLVLRAIFETIEAITPARLSGIALQQDGSVALTVTGNESYELEGSADMVHWDKVSPLYRQKKEDGELLHFSHTGEKQFFRLRLTSKTEEK